MKKQIRIALAVLLSAVCSGIFISCGDDQFDDLKVNEVSITDTQATSGDSGSSGGTNLPPKP